MQGRTAALCNSFDDAGAIAESRAEKDVRVHEQTLFERRPAAEPCAEERADILRECGVDLVQDEHHSRLELQQRHN